MRRRSLLITLAAGLLFTACSDSGPSGSATTAPATSPSAAPTTSGAPTTTPATEAPTTTEPPLTLDSLSGRVAIESTSCDEQLKETNNSPIGQICVLNLADMSVVNLSDPAIDETSPRWSPDGTRLVFDSLVYGENQRLVIANADGSGRVNVTGNKFYSSWADWSPDGTTFLIGANILAPTTGVEMNPGDGFTLLPIDENAWHPKWSPDGEWVVYSSDLYGTPEELECQTLFVARVDGSDTRQLLADPAGGDALGPCAFDGAEWSPDGEWLVFAMSDNAGQNLWVMRSDGSELTQLTTGQFGGSRPTWSPDGTYILYSADDATGQPQLYVRTFAGGADAQVLELPLPAGLLHGVNWVDWTA